MNRIALSVTALALAAAACARAAPSSPSGASRPAGKPGAPVAVEAQLSAGSARVGVRFDADAKDVRITVHGTGGLAVTSAAAPVEKGTFARGESTTFDVSFTPGPGRSHLVVAVDGVFHGAGRRARVASFAFGEPTPEQLGAEGTVVEGPDGERLKVVVPER